MGIGILASYLLKFAEKSVNSELFKYADDLDYILSKQVPRIIGFADYSWNLNLLVNSQFEYMSKESTREAGGFGITPRRG